MYVGATDFFEGYGEFYGLFWKYIGFLFHTSRFLLTRLISLKLVSDNLTLFRAYIRIYVPFLRRWFPPTTSWISSIGHTVADLCADCTRVAVLIIIVVQRLAGTPSRLCLLPRPEYSCSGTRSRLIPRSLQLDLGQLNVLELGELNKH